MRAETDRERERQNGAFLVCDGTIGHFLHWDRCPKAKTMSKTVFQGLSDETLCNLVGFIQPEQYRFKLLHLRTIVVYGKGWQSVSGNASNCQIELGRIGRGLTLWWDGQTGH